MDEILSLLDQIADIEAHENWPHPFIDRLISQIAEQAAEIIWPNMRLDNDIIMRLQRVVNRMKDLGYNEAQINAVKHLLVNYNARQITR